MHLGDSWEFWKFHDFRQFSWCPMWLLTCSLLPPEESASHPLSSTRGVPQVDKKLIFLFKICQNWTRLKMSTLFRILVRSTLLQVVRSTFLRGPKSQKPGVLHFVFLVTVCHELSCVKWWSNWQSRFPITIIFDVLSDSPGGAKLPRGGSSTWRSRDPFNLP